MLHLRSQFLKAIVRTTIAHHSGDEVVGKRRVDTIASPIDEEALRVAQATNDSTERNRRLHHGLASRRRILRDLLHITVEDEEIKPRKRQ